MGLASWRQGDLESAATAYAESMRRFEAEGWVADVLGCAITLADLQWTQGRLRDAERTYRDALDLAGRQPGGPRPRDARHARRARRDRWRARRPATRPGNSCGSATSSATTSGCRDTRTAGGSPRRTSARPTGTWPAPSPCSTRPSGCTTATSHPTCSPVAAMRARVWVKQGRPDQALAWAARARARGDRRARLPARVRARDAGPGALAGAEDRTAAGFLERLLTAAEAGGRHGTVLEILVLLAVARSSAATSARRWPPCPARSSSASQRDIARTFTDEGPTMASLLSAAAKRGVARSYATRLLGSTNPAPRESARHEALVDPLSDRELDVLRLLASELSGPEIARHLVVSLNTVRTHTKNIYAKLGVGTRREAVRRADELGLLGVPRLSLSADHHARSPHVVIRAPHVGSYVPEHERNRNRDLRDPRPRPPGRAAGPPGSTAWRSSPPMTAARSSVARSPTRQPCTA